MDGNTEGILALNDAFSPYVHSCGIVDRPVVLRQDRRLPYFVFLSCLEGSLEIIVEGLSYTLKPGQTVVLEPTLPHRLRACEGDSRIWVHADLVYSPYRHLRSHARDLRVPLSWPKGIDHIHPGFMALTGTPITIGPHAKLVEQLSAVVDCWERSDACWQMWARHHLGQAVLQLWQQQGDNSPTTTEGRLCHAETMARARLANETDVVQMAKWAGMSRASFHRHYQKVRGRSPGAFLDELRLEQADAMLGGDLNIADISMELGFSSPAAFVRFFKRHRGVPPGKSRDQGDVG